MSIKENLRSLMIRLAVEGLAPVMDQLRTEQIVSPEMERAIAQLVIPSADALVQTLTNQEAEVAYAFYGMASLQEKLRAHDLVMGAIGVQLAMNDLAMTYLVKE